MTTQRFQPDRCKKCGGRMHRTGILVTPTLYRAIYDIVGGPYADAAGRFVTSLECERCGWTEALAPATDE